MRQLIINREKYDNKLLSEKKMQQQIVIREKYGNKLLTEKKCGKNYEERKNMATNY